MTGPVWRVLATQAMLTFLSFLAIHRVYSQGTSLCTNSALNNCIPSAYCIQDGDSYRCGCPPGFDGDGLENGYGCTKHKYSTWHVVSSIIGSVIGAILIFYLCLACIGHRRRQQQQMAFPMQPMGNPPVYGYPQPGVPAQQVGNPAVYGYPPQGPPLVSTKIPGPSGVV